MITIIITIENTNKYKKQKNSLSKLYKNKREKFYSNLEIRNITNDKLFCMYPGFQNISRTQK